MMKITKQSLESMIKAGNASFEIAAHFQVTEKAVRAAVLRLGLQDVWLKNEPARRLRLRDAPPIDLGQLRKLCAEGNDIIRLMMHLKRSGSTIVSAARKHGICIPVAQRNPGPTEADDRAWLERVRAQSMRQPTHVHSQSSLVGG